MLSSPSAIWERAENPVVSVAIPTKVTLDVKYKTVTSSADAIGVTVDGNSCQMPRRMEKPRPSAGRKIG